MLTTATTDANRTPEVIPPIRHAVPWRVAAVTALPDARLRVVFVDGTTGQVAMAAFLSNPRVRGTVREPLGAPAVVARAETALGAVRWPNGANLAPDAMYDAIREHGVRVLD